MPTLVSVGGTRILNADPRFVDTAHGDYSLTAASPAVDFAAEVPGTDVDLIGHTRDIDLDVVPNRYGPRDLGALEREAVQPLVQNANFDVDLRLWNLWDPSSSTWDATHNIVGSAGSGSLRMAFADSSPGQTIHPRVQCVHIPGPGTYRLNGWGQSAGPTSPQRDRVSVLWHYRRFGNGSEDCFAGAVDQLGEFTITTGTTWVESVNPAYISVPASEWTSYSTLLIFPGATERGFGGGVSENILGWIDGITLDLETDIIFANGFDG